MSTPETTTSQPAGHAATSHATAEAAHTSPAVAPPSPAAPAPKRHWLLKVVVGLVVIGVALAAVPWVLRSLRTVSTDDAYVNGHVTFVAPRVSGQVVRVLVDDNNRVHKGDLLVQLDREPYQVQVNIAASAVAAAAADLAAAQAQARAVEGQMRSLRFTLTRSIEDVHNQIAMLRSRVATLKSQQASLDRAQADFDRAKPLLASKALSREDFDLRKETLLVAQSRLEEALQGVYQVRVALGLPLRPESGDDLAQVPDDLDQKFSSVKQAQSSLMQAAAQLGLNQSFDMSPTEMVAEFYRRDPQGKIDRIYEQILKDAPSVKQAQSKLTQAQRNLDLAELNLRYCDVTAEIDGVVTRRSVNPGNNVVSGQSLMAIRSLTEIWIDANFKETQLAYLRIGQAVDLDVDMYGSLERFQGRISGFTMGTGSTLALLPAENATGNFVKVVQRLPVRIELLDYDADKSPLFIGLSVTPYVHIKEEPTGPDAGKLLQPYMPATAADSRPDAQP
jgi:membrane fusion protein, multidrug efflux system